MTSHNPDLVAAYTDAIASFNSHDVQEMVTHCQGHVVVHDHGAQRTVDGHDEVKVWLQEWVDAFPDGTLAIEESMAVADRSITRMVFHGTNRGPLGALPASSAG